MTSPIFGPTATTLAQALAWATQRGAHPRAQAIIPLYYQHAPRYGIPAENGVGQSSWETNDWKYTGQVPPEYRNMCGLKTRRATGDRPEDHARFQSDEMGVIAHLQHLARYGGMQADAVPDPIYDPRFYLVTAFTDTIEGLGGAWAPDPGYGSRVSNRIASLVATEVPMPEYISGLVDVRDKLATNYSAGHGPDEHIPMTEKRGIVVHYGGPPVNLARPSLDILKSYAAYHVSKNWAREGQPPVRGTGLMYHVFDHYGPSKKGNIGQRNNGVLISNGTGKVLAFALFNLQERGRMFVGPGDEAYEGMIVGLHSRDNDLIVNVCKAKQLTNIRAAGSDENIILTPPIQLTLEQALEFIEDDELVEVTPQFIRVRKKFLKEHERKRATRN